MAYYDTTKDKHKGQRAGKDNTMNNRISHTRATIIKTVLSNIETGITVQTKNEHWTDKDFHLGVKLSSLRNRGSGGDHPVCHKPCRNRKGSRDDQ